ncbi:Fe-S cluster biogenesis protein NfuA [Roseiarcus fermentans]|uniref:Fe-S cluster biogenesis protein NfuA n=1 Tax=Roseiarcus fermentans TaxID=1473586 RepID=A0A366EPT4_9HYPH|nr:NifU family protein [Roseiarcus fermentans]RBP03485.1 Fe-S cluster biogenesis protein NfuA [Roseiarcus fermentans]
MFEAAPSDLPSFDDQPPRPERVRLIDMQRRPSVARAPQPAGPACAPRPARNLDRPEHLAAIEAALAELRPRLQADGGDCCLVGVEGDVVRIRMSGACSGCQLASMTVLGVRMKLIEKLGFPVKVVPV